MPPKGYKNFRFSSLYQNTKKQVDNKQSNEIVKLRKEVKNLKGTVEIKTADKSTTATFCDYSGALNPEILTNVGQGDSQSQRDGNVMYLKKLVLRFHLHDDESAYATNVKVYLAQNMSDDAGTAPTNSQLFQINSGNNSIALPHDNNVDTQLDYKIIKEWNIDMDGALRKGKTVYFTKRWKKPLALKYDGTASTNWTKNHLFIGFIGNQSTYVPAYSYESRIYFTD